MLDAVAQRVQTARLAFEVFRAPDAKTIALVNFDGRVQNLAGWRVTIVKRGGINKWFERRARLALGLRGAIEFRLVKRKAAHHGKNPARERIHRCDCAGDFRNLAEAILARFRVQRLDVNDIARDKNALQGFACPSDALRRNLNSLTHRIDSAGAIL